MHILFEVFQDTISNIEDPRQERKVRHRLDELLWLMFCAVLCGAESADEIEEYGLRKLSLLRHFYPYAYGIASASTLERLLRVLHPNALRDVLLAVMRALVPTLAGKLIALDGKTSRGSKDNQFKALHHLSAFVTDARLVIAHQATEEKSNEITAIPELLDLIDITGSVVSMDAMGTQRSIAQKIIDKAADYFMGLKGNQGNLQRDVEIIFGQMLANPTQHAIDRYEHTDKGHGRMEERICTVSYDVQRIQALHDWPGLQAIARVESARTIQGKMERETRWYLSSQKADAKTMLTHSRGHWSVENSLHYVLDVTFHEDAARHRKDHAAENMTILRKLTLNFIQTTKSPKDSIKKFRKRLGWDDHYLYSLITGNS